MSVSFIPWRCVADLATRCVKPTGQQNRRRDIQKHLISFTSSINEFWGLASSYPDTAAKKDKIAVVWKKIENLKGALSAREIGSNDRQLFDCLCEKFRNLKNNHDFLCLVVDHYTKLCRYTDECCALAKKQELSGSDQKRLFAIAEHREYIKSMVDRWQNRLSQKQKDRFSEQFLFLDAEIEAMQNRYLLMSRPRIQKIAQIKELFALQLKNLDNLAKRVSTNTPWEKSLQELRIYTRGNYDYVQDSLEELQVDLSPNSNEYGVVFQKNFEKWFSTEDFILRKLEEGALKSFEDVQKELLHFKTKYHNPTLYAELSPKLKRYGDGVLMLGEARTDLNRRAKKSFFSAFRGLRELGALLEKRLDFEPPETVFSKMNQYINRYIFPKVNQHINHYLQGFFALVPLPSGP